MVFLSHPVVPGVTLCFAPVRMTPPPAADFCSRDKFRTTFLSVLHYSQVWWHWPIYYLIRFWSILNVTLIFQIWNLLYLSQTCPVVTKQKAYISPELLASNVTLGLDIGHDLDLEFSRPNMGFAIPRSQKVQVTWNEKQTYRLNSRSQLWPSGFTLTMTLKWKV